MRFRLVFSVLISVLLFSPPSFSPDLVGVARAEQDCPATYTVERGDTLSSIALRFGTTVWELMALNQGRLRHPNLIFVGQEICLPVAPNESQVALEATYQYTPDDEEAMWTLTARGGYLGKRVVYPLKPIEPIDTVGAGSEMVPEITTAPYPVLVGVRNQEEANSYTLVALDSPDILSSLHISGTVPTRSQCEELAPDVKQALGDEAVNEASLVVWLEGRDGLRFPFYVSRVDSLADPVLFEECYTGPGKDDKIGFALYPADSEQLDGYGILMVLSEEGLGPPGRGWRARCSGWGGGRFHRWLRAWYGC